MKSNQSLLQTGEDALERGESAKAFEAYLHEANGGDSTAMTMIGWMYQAGVGVAKDEAAAEGWYKRATESGSVEAQFFHGRLLIESGRTEGLADIRSAAEAGHIPAMYFLGGCLQEAWEARKVWLQRGATRGNVFCRLLLGKLLFKEGGIRNRARGLSLIAASFAGTLFHAARLRDVKKIRSDQVFHR